MLSDSLSETINDILKAVSNYNDYSFINQKRIILALSHLYLVQWTSDRLKGEMNSTFHDAKRHATIEFDRAVAGALSE